VKSLLLSVGAWLLTKLLWFTNRDRRLGQAEEQTETTSDVLDEVAKAKRARDKLRDPAYRKRVRDKYTRD